MKAFKNHEVRIMDYNEINTFVSENIKTIFAYALSRVSDKNDADDLAGDIIEAVLKNAHKLKNKEALYGYIWGIAANVCKKFLYKRKRNNTLFKEISEFEDSDYLSDNSEVSDNILRREEIYLLRRELSLLSRQYRECTVAYYIDEMSCSEVSKKFGISLDMVKYYLFKTRKILKEGIGMTREYGEKSYKPGEFHFHTLVDQHTNSQYGDLFSRKLPGNILLSAYYTPMTINELSLELGVSTVYMEDEIDLLERYKLIKSISGTKYQTNIIIFTKAYEKELFVKADNYCVPEITKILVSLKKLLPEVRKIGFRGSHLSDNQLLWSLYVQSIFNASCEFDGEYQNNSELYKGTRGIVYGSDYDENEYPIHGVSGRYGTDDKYAISFVNFGVLNNKWDNWSDAAKEIMQDIENTTENANPAEFPIYTKDEFASMQSILREVFKSMGIFLDKFAQNACDIMKSHAPAFVHDQINTIVSQKLMFTVIGYMGAVGLKSNILIIPEKDQKATVTGFIVG